MDQNAFLKFLLPIVSHTVMYLNKFRLVFDFLIISPDDDV